YSNAIYGPSDLALKDKIQDLKNAESILSQFNPKTFEFKNSQYPHMNLPVNERFGLIAQEVEAVLPNLVKNFIQPEEIDSLGNIVNPEVTVKAVNYTEFIPILIAAYNEQRTKLDLLEDKLTLMENTLNSLTGGGLKNSNNITEVTLENTMAIILDQNVPNPFADETKINYFLPDDVTNAKIIFYELSGKILKEVELKTRGEGQLHVYGQDLSSGIYTYTLLIDGKVFETKKMVKTK
ncbi:MAG: tail fiber domain-containing protein, partial [Bacteroidia bacterium]